jgi:peptide/nickel transport system substrate-binding protein
MKRFAVLAVALAIMFAGATAISAQTTLVYGSIDKVTDMDPASSYDFHPWEIFQNTNLGLLTYEPGTAKVIPGLAEAMPTISADGLEYTFKLRKGLKFTDGTAFDADSVKWTIDRVARINGDPAVLVTDNVKEVQVIDTYTVKFILKGPRGYFNSLVAGCPPYFPISPNVWPADKSVHDVGELNGGAVVGLGPYNLTSFKRDEEAVFEANPNYFGKPPAIKKIIIKYFADATTMRLAVEKGDVDLAFNGFNPADVTSLSKNPKLVSVPVAGLRIRYLAFNTDVSVFKDKLLRQALAALVNRPEIVQKVFLGQAKPIYSMIPEGMDYGTNDFKTVFGDGNVAKAEGLLTKAGYSKAKPFAFDLWYSPSHYGNTEVNVAEVLKTQFEKTAMIKVTIKSAEWATYKQQWNNKQMGVYLLGWYPDYLDPDDYTSIFGGTTGSAGMGIFFSSKTWDDLFTKEQESADPKVRGAAFAQVQKMWTDEVMTVPIWVGNLALFTQKNVTGVKIGATAIFNYNIISFKK